MPQSSFPHIAPIAACVLRGSIVESRHEAHIAEADSYGNVLAAAGERDLIATLRSSGKPLQAIPAITLPGASDLDLTDEEVAICCASHPGTPRHAALAASVLALSGFIPDNLVCGAPGDATSPLRHGCSGNHAAILLTAHLLKAPLEGYEHISHPAQQEILRVIRSLSGSEAEIAVDGCGVPTFGLPLSAMARAFANLTVSGAPWERIPRVMGAHPDLIGAQDWIDVRLMEVTQGRLVAKTGAEGLLCVGHAGRGVAIKIMDGSTRALGAATIAWLFARGWITAEEADDERLANLRRPPILDPCGRKVGEIRVSLEAMSRK